MTMTQHVESQQAVVNDLKGRIRGPLLRPGDPGFDEARSVWNAMIDRRPALIVRCLGVSDVVACVNAAREHGMPLSIKGGGHNIAGLAVCEGGLMLDMSLMRGVWVDPAARVARAQAGCLLGDVDAETQLHGLAAVLGFVSAHRLRGADARRRIRIPHAAVRLDDRQPRVGRSRHRRRSSGPRIRTGEQRPLLGAARRRRQLRRRHELRVQASPRRSGGRRRRDCLAWRGGSRRPRDVSIVGDAGAARADVRGRAAPGAAGALARQGRPRQADRRPLRVLFGTAGGGRDGCWRRSRPSARRSATSCRSGPTSRSRRCSTPPSRRDAATTGSPSTSRSLEPELFTPAIEHASRIVSPHSAILIFPIDGALNELPEDHSAGRQPGCGRRPQHRERVGARRGRRRQHRVGARRLARHAPVLHRRHLRQLPHRRGRRRPHPRRVPHELRPPGRGQGRSGIPRISSARTRTSVLHAKAAVARSPESATASAPPRTLTCARGDYSAACGTGVSSAARGTSITKTQPLPGRLR